MSDNIDELFDMASAEEVILGQKDMRLKEVCVDAPGETEAFLNYVRDETTTMKRIAEILAEHDFGSRKRILHYLDMAIHREEFNE